MIAAAIWSLVAGWLEPLHQAGALPQFHWQLRDVFPDDLDGVGVVAALQIHAPPHVVLRIEKVEIITLHAEPLARFYVANLVLQVNPDEALERPGLRWTYRVFATRLSVVADT